MKNGVLYLFADESRYGAHGYLFDELPGARYAKVPHLITPVGYGKKLTGAQLKDEKYNPKWDYSEGVCEAKYKVIKPEDTTLKYVDFWKENATVEDLIADIESLEVENLIIKLVGKCGMLSSSETKPDVPNLKVSYADDRTDKNGKEIGEDREYCAYAVRNTHFRGKGFFIKSQSTADYWESDKDFPPELIHKWSYTLTSEIARKHECHDGNVYHEYFLGDHAKSNDELEVLGKEDPTTGFALVWLKEPCQVLDDIAKRHAEVVWSERRKLERFDVIGMVNINNITRPKIRFDIRNFGIDVFKAIDYNTRLLSGTDELVSMCLIPPRISYRVLGIRDEMRRILDSYFGSNYYPNLHLTDITDLVYRDGKLTDMFGMTEDMFTLCPNNHVGDERKVQFIRGLDYPLRATFSGIAETVKSVKIITWPFSERVYRYGTIIETENGVGFWAAGYSGKMFCL